MLQGLAVKHHESLLVGHASSLDTVKHPLCDLEGSVGAERVFEEGDHHSEGLKSVLHVAVFQGLESAWPLSVRSKVLLDVQTGPYEPWAL